MHSFKLRIFNIVAVCLYLAHFYLCNFCNTTPRRDPMGVIHQSSSSDSRGKDGVDFISCVRGREPQIHKLWSYAEDGITRKFHPFLSIDVGNLYGDCFKTNYSTEVGRRVAIYGQISINGSVELISVPAPFCNNGVAWTDNLLVPESRWGDEVRVGKWAWVTKPGVLIGAEVLLRSVIPACPAYLPRSPPKNARATARRVCDACLLENCLARAQNILYTQHICGDEQVNWSYENWDDIWDKLADQ